MFTGRGTLGRGLQMPADERQVRQEQSSPKRPVAAVQPSPGNEVVYSRRQEPTSSPLGRGITRRQVAQVAQTSERSDFARTTSETGSQQMPSAPFGRGFARTASTSESEIEVSASSSQRQRRATTLEDRLRRMDISDQLVEERGTYGEE